MMMSTETDPVESPPRTWVKILLTVIVLSIAAMWIYAFAFAPREGVYRVRSDQWRADAQQVCLAAREQRFALADTSAGYIANPTNEQMTERANVVDKATDILDTMLDDLEALPLAETRDRELVTIWLGHYRTLMGDRRVYTERLRVFNLQPFEESTVLGGPITNVLSDFTSGNDIKACVPPGELGGDR